MIPPLDMGVTGTCPECGGRGIAKSHRWRLLSVAGEGPKIPPPCSYCVGSGAVEYEMAAPALGELLVEVRFKDGVTQRFSGPPESLLREGMMVGRPDRVGKVLARYLGEIVDGAHVFEEIDLDASALHCRSAIRQDEPAAPHDAHRQCGLRVCRDEAGHE